MRVLGAMLLMVVTSFAWADVLVMKNGDRLTGTVDSISGGEVLLKTEYAGPVPIKLDAIAQMITEDSFDVVTAQGKTQGKFAIENDNQVLTADGGSQPVELASLQSAGQNNLSLTRLTADWSSRADLAATFSNGNTDTQQYSLLVESILKQESVEHSLSLLIANEKAEEETTKDLLALDYGYKRFVSERWYASGNAQYFEDALKDVDSRITVGAGMGYQFWDDSFGSLYSDLGVSYVREDINGDTSNNPALRWGLDYKRYLLSKQLEAFYNHALLYIPDSDRGEVFESSTGLRYALNARVSAVARIDFRHETDPAPGNGKSDVTYNIGIGAKF